MFNFIAVFCALLILLSGCQAHMGPARIQQQSINAALFSCSTLESCEMYAGAPEQKWKIFYLRDSVWEPGLVETATVPGRIIWRERVTKTLFKEHRDYVKTWHLLDGRLYKYEASSEPLLAGWKSIETCLNGRIVDVFFLGERGWVISEKGAIGITSNSGKQWKSSALWEFGTRTRQPCAEG